MHIQGWEKLTSEINTALRPLAVEPGWEVVAPHPFSIVCFRQVEADNDALARAVTATGEVFIASAVLRGQTILRIAIGNAATTEDDVRRTWEALKRCAA